MINELDNFESAIRKGLIDKESESDKSNPSILINENNKNIQQSINRNLKECQRADIAVSYVVVGGLNQIKKNLKRLGSDSRFLLTIDGLVTDPNSLRELTKMDLSVKVYAPSDNTGFHLKSYYFQKEKGDTLIIGSANISIRAFGDVHEMGIEVNANNKAYIIDEYQKVFNDLWMHKYSIDLDDFDIDEYEVLFYEKRRIESDYASIITNKDVKPNYMQEQALEKLEEARQEGQERGLVIAATGTGKTYLAAFDVKAFQPKKLLFLVHNRLILTAAKQTFQNLFPDRRILELNSSNINMIDAYSFIFTTDKTAYNHLINKVDSIYFDYIIVDEAHKVGQGTYYDQIIDYFKPEFLLGITATPERTDNARYLFEKYNFCVVYEIRLMDSLDRGLVCPFTYYGLSVDYDIDKKDVCYDEVALYIQEQINDKGHYGQKLKCIIFCGRQEEARKLNESLNKIGFNSVSITTDDNVDRELIETYFREIQEDENPLQILCVVDKLNEGVDIPEINTIVMLRRTVSPIIYIQQLGRGLRRTSDPNKFVTIIDLIGNDRNNYTIAQVLTGNETVDKRELLNLANTNFIGISPYINVDIEEKAMKQILSSITTNFKVETELKSKFKNELQRYEVIPSLLELYLNPVFHEIELLQLICKNFYEPFKDFYVNKFDINVDKDSSKFLNDFFSFSTQFLFRAYDNNTLKDYSKLLNNELISNDLLMKILSSKGDNVIGRMPSALNSEYYKESNSYPKVFNIVNSNNMQLNQEIIEKLKSLNAYDLFLEQVELIEYLSKNKTDYVMNVFDLVSKAEFLLNTGSNDLYLNAVGEKVIDEYKSVYCPITVSKEIKNYDNYLIDNKTLVYQTQTSNSAFQATSKINKIKDYRFNICATFPHLGYSNTSYFNMGKVTIKEIKGPIVNEQGKYNHEIVFTLEKPVPAEMMLYKDELLN